MIPAPGDEATAVLYEGPALGIVEAGISFDELEVVIRAVDMGYSVGASERLSSMYAENDGPIDPEAFAITKRETEVLRLVADGFSNVEIAGYLSISDNTVKYHLSKLMDKLGAANRTEAVMRGIQAGAIEL